MCESPEQCVRLYSEFLAPSVKVMVQFANKLCDRRKHGARRTDCVVHSCVVYGRLLEYDGLVEETLSVVSLPVIFAVVSGYHLS